MGRRDPIVSAERLEQQGKLRAAFNVLLRAARRGDHSVWLNLGYAYDVGQGVKRSSAKALRWYRLAAGDGNAAGAHNVATVDSVRGDVAGALRWLERAVQLGDSGSNLLMGQLLLSRMGQPHTALACFRAVGNEECEAVVEASRAWAAMAENIIAQVEPRGGRTRG